MARRRGIAATAASALVFSTILISSFALTTSSQNREILYAKSGSENLLYDQSRAFASTAEGKALMGAESAIGMSVLNCESAGVQIGELVGGISAKQTAAGTSVAVHLSYSDGGSNFDDSSLGPFDGHVQGNLNLVLSVNLSGSDHTGVDYKAGYSIPANLPAHLQSAISDCLAASSTVESSLSAANVHACNATKIQMLILQASRQATSLATQDGFVFGLTFAIANQGTCLVSYTVAIDQVGIIGPEGTFSLRLRQPGSVYLGPPS